MTNEVLNRQTVIATKKESTVGTVVAVAGATDFIPVLDGFDISPAFDVISNEELQASIGRAKDTKGFEKPTASIDLYMKASGVEGTAPSWGEILESCLGSVATAASEYLTTSSSTTSLIKLASGGSTFVRGQALLIKDSVNNYQIRNVSSIATNDLSIAQNVAVAPGTGFGTGKAIMYYPANSSHPSISLWAYRANQGALELISGAKVTEVTINANAGEAVKISCSMAGVEYFFDPFVITASNKYIDWTDDTGTFAAAIPVDVYKDPYEMATAIEDAMNGLTAKTVTCTYSDSTRKFTIACTGSVFSLLWNTGSNTANSAKTTLGFANTDDTGATSYASDTAVSYAAAYTPSFDSIDIPIAKNNEVLFGLSTDSTAFAASSVQISIKNENSYLNNVCAVSGQDGTAYTSREVKVVLSSYLTLGQADEFKKFRANDSVVFTYNFGEKSSNNWVAGKCCNIHIPTAIIEEFKLNDKDGFVALDMTLKAYVSSGLGEVYINFL